VNTHSHSGCPSGHEVSSACSRRWPAPRPPIVFRRATRRRLRGASGGACRCSVPPQPLAQEFLNPRPRQAEPQAQATINPAKPGDHSPFAQFHPAAADRLHPTAVAGVMPAGAGHFIIRCPHPQPQPARPPHPPQVHAEAGIGHRPTARSALAAAGADRGIVRDHVRCEHLGRPPRRAGLLAAFRPLSPPPPGGGVDRRRLVRGRTPRPVLPHREHASASSARPRSRPGPRRPTARGRELLVGPWFNRPAPP